ncbi:Exosome complex component RRP43, partial [Coelomomyces lativittatus]
MFGDHFYMVMTELIPEGPSKTLYLQSIPKSTLSYSPLGKQGQVSLTTQCTSACLWKLVPDDPYYLLEREGTPVQPGNRVCLQHCLSVPNIELTPLCSNQFKPGPPSPLAQSLSRFIADVHAKTPIIDLEQLCIDPGNAVWTLYADMYCLSYHGNILDAAWIALISALHSVRLPKAIYEDGCVRASKDKSLGTPLRFLHLPFTCTFATFD